MKFEGECLHGKILVHIMTVHMLYRLLHKRLGLVASLLLNQDLYLLTDLLHPSGKLLQIELLHLLVDILFLRENKPCVYLIGQKKFMNIGHQIHQKKLILLQRGLFQAAVFNIEVYILMQLFL